MIPRIAGAMVAFQQFPNGFPMMMDALVTGKSIDQVLREESNRMKVGNIPPEPPEISEIISQSPDILDQVIYQLQNPGELMTPWGPSLPQEVVGGIVGEYPGIAEMSDIDVNEADSILRDAENMSDVVGQAVATPSWDTYMQDSDDVENIFTSAGADIASGGNQNINDAFSDTRIRNRNIVPSLEETTPEALNLHDFRNLVSEAKTNSDKIGERSAGYDKDDPKTIDVFEGLDLSLDQDSAIGVERGTAMLTQIMQRPEYLDRLDWKNYSDFANMALERGDMSENIHKEIMRQLGIYLDNTAMKAGPVQTPMQAGPVQTPAPGYNPQTDLWRTYLEPGSVKDQNLKETSPWFDLPAGFPTPHFLGGTPGAGTPGAGTPTESGRETPLMMSEEAFGTPTNESSMFDLEWNKLPGATQYAMRNSKNKIQSDAELLFRVYNPTYQTFDGSSLKGSTDYLQSYYPDFLRTYISGGENALDERYGGGQNLDSRIDDILSTIKDFDATGSYPSKNKNWYYGFHPNSPRTGGEVNYERLSNYLSTRGLAGTFADQNMTNMMSDMRNRALSTGESPYDLLNTIVSMRKASAGGK